MRVNRVISDYLLDSEILLFLLTSSLIILGIPAPFFSLQWYIVFALLASLLIAWISSIAIKVMIQLSKQRLTPADSLFFSTAVSIPISALSLSIFAVSSVANMLILSILAWTSIQSIAVVVLFIALLRYIQAFRERLGESGKHIAQSRTSLMIPFSVIVFTSYFTTFLIDSSIGVFLGLAAILILRIPSIILSARVLKMSNSVKMNSMISFLILGISLEAVGDILLVLSIIKIASFCTIWSISTHILGFFFLLASCVSFVRWRSSPSGMVRLLQKAMEIIVSGVMELARKTRGRR